MEKTWLELTDSKSSKFYEVILDGCDVTIRYGRIGQKGTQKRETCASTDAARAQASKKIEAKLSKGYTRTLPKTPAEDPTQVASPAASPLRIPLLQPRGVALHAPILWQLPTGGSAFGLCVDEAGCWIGNENGHIYRLSHDGDLMLHFVLPDGVKCIVSDDAWFYAGCNDGKVYDLSGKVPHVAYEIPDAVDVHWLDILDGRLAVSDAFGQVSAIDHEGEILWQRKGKRSSGWMVRCDALGVFHGHQDGVALYHWQDGQIIWEQPLARSVLYGWCEPSSVFVATSGEKIHQFSKAGEEWEAFRCDASVFCCTAAEDGELVFAGDNAAYVYCFSGDGTRLWKASTGCGAAQSMHYREGRLYIVTMLGHAACIDVGQEAMLLALQHKIPTPRVIEAVQVQPTQAKAKVSAKAASVAPVSSTTGTASAPAPSTGILLECYKEAGSLRVRVISEGYEAAWNVQFPKALREEGARYQVPEVRVARQGGFYRVYGEIQKLSPIT